MNFIQKHLSKFCGTYWKFFFLVAMTSSCVYPGITLNKGRLLDPTIDPAKTGTMADSLGSHSSKQFERSSIAAGGSSGGACPTCK